MRLPSESPEDTASDSAPDQPVAPPDSDVLPVDQVTGRAHRECRVQIGCQPQERTPAVTQCYICMDSACTWCTIREHLLGLAGSQMTVDLCYRCFFARTNGQGQTLEPSTGLMTSTPARARPPPLNSPRSCKVQIICRADPPAEATSRCLLCWDPACEMVSCTPKAPVGQRRATLLQVFQRTFRQSRRGSSPYKCHQASGNP